MGNTFKTALLLTSLTLALVFLGDYFGGQHGMVVAVVIAGLTNFVAYFFSDKIALACTAPNRLREKICRKSMRLSSG